MIALSVAMLVTPQGALAANFDAQIRAAQQQQQAAQQRAGQLSAQGDTLANKVASLNAQADQLQAQITLNGAKSQRLTVQIAENQAELVRKKDVLNENIRTIYQQSDVSPLEMLASSKNFSEYVDKQQYMDKLKTHVTDSLEEITVLKADLERQQREVRQLIADQGAMQQQLVAQRGQVAKLLAETRGEEARYAQMASANKAEVERLQAQQAAALAASFGGGSTSANSRCGGGYPYCNVTFVSYEADPWGMYKRQCVSYTAFRVANSGRSMPYWGGRGNANQWPSNARAAGIPMDLGSGARVGDVAITTSGPYGHSMYVEEVIGDKVRVSQYNFGNDGNYSQMTVPQAGMYFIHF